MYHNSISEEINKFVRENGGNERDALNIALARLKSLSQTLERVLEESEQRQQALDNLLGEVSRMKPVSVSERMPPSGKLVLASGVNELGKKRTLRAMYVPRYTMEVECEGDYEAEEYDQDGNCFLKEGWYEMNEFEDTHWYVSFPITHWKELPWI